MIAACLLLLCLPAPSAAQSTATVVIVNDKVTSPALTVKDLMDIYTLNKSHWDDGTRIAVFDLKNGRTKESFLAYVGMTENDLKRIWLRKQFTGKARPPRAVASEDEVVDLVGRTPGAIGYVSERSLRNTSTVRIIARVR